MIKKIETLNEKEQVYELISLEIKEEALHFNIIQSKPDKEFVFETFDYKNEIYFINVENEIVNGYIRIHMINFVDEIWIHGLYARANNSDVIKALLDETIKFAKSNGKKSIRLYAYSHNLVVLKLYEEYGFKEIQRLMSREL